VSEGDVQVARKMHPAFNRTFTEGTGELFDVLHPDAEWIPITSAVDGVTYRGEEAIRGWIAEMKRQWEFYETRPNDFLDLGDGRVLALGTWGARGRVSGLELDSQPGAWLIAVEGDKVTMMRTYSDRAKAFEAAGLE
jgi:ketosteroid isomerase-like protein